MVTREVAGSKFFAVTSFLNGPFLSKILIRNFDRFEDSKASLKATSILKTVPKYISRQFPKISDFSILSENVGFCPVITVLLVLELTQKNL